MNETFCKQDGINLKEFILRLLDELDKRYLDRFKSLDSKVDSAYREQKEAVATALLAQEKAVNTAFSASDKAIIKAEEAQKDYNNRSNEFRGQLDDQAKMLMPRVETIGLFKASDDKLESFKKASDDKFESERLTLEKINDAILKEIAGLRESRSEGQGKSQSNQENWTKIISIIIATGIVVGIIERFIK